MARLLGTVGIAALACALLLGACSSPASPPALSPGARRTLTEAMGNADGDASSLDALRQAALQAPDDAAAQERYGLAAERARQYPEALAALARAVDIGGPTPARLTIEGRIAFEMGDVPAAASAYRQALARDPGNVDALSGLGVAEDLLDHHEAARALYAQALRLAPGDWGVRSNLALSFLMSDRAVDATGALAGAADDPAAPRRAREDLAMALVASGDRTKAIAVLSRDVPPAEASALADKFADFAKWLATATAPAASLPRP